MLRLVAYMVSPKQIMKVLRNDKQCEGSSTGLFYMHHCIGNPWLMLCIGNPWLMFSLPQDVWMIFGLELCYGIGSSPSEFAPRWAHCVDGFAMATSADGRNQPSNEGWRQALVRCSQLPMPRPSTTHMGHIYHEAPKACLHTDGFVYFWQLIWHHDAAARPPVWTPREHWWWWGSGRWHRSN